MEKFKRWQTYALMAVCVLINLIGRYTATKLQMPYWLDAIGTIIAAIELGPVCGAICGALLNIILGFWQIKTAAYFIVSVSVGITVGVIYSKSSDFSMYTVLSVGMLTGLLSVILSTMLSLKMYDGRTGNIWGDGLIDMISRDVNVPLICSFLGDAFVNIPDKLLSMLAATGAIRLFRSCTDRRKKATAAKMLLFMLFPLAALTMPINTKAFDMKSEYAAVLYDTDNGLDTMEINAMCGREPMRASTGAMAINLRKWFLMRGSTMSWRFL